MYAIKQTEGYQSSVNNGIARTLKKLGTSKAEKCTKQFFLFNCVLFQIGTFSKRKEFAPREVPYGMQNHFYHIRLPTLNVTIFNTHMRNLRNDSYANGQSYTASCLAAIKHLYLVWSYWR